MSRRAWKAVAVWLTIEAITALTLIPIWRALHG